LGKRYRQLSARGKNANQVVVAVARALRACMWAIALDIGNHINARPELLPEAEAQRTLEAVSSRPLFGTVC
jgi:hypothetical protein